MESNTFFYDLLQAQKEIEGVDKDGKNPFFKSDYATLNATILACKQILNAHNIVLLQPIVSDEHGVYVATTLIHASSEQKVESRMRIIPAKVNDPQAQGSAITYARRYALKSLLCMSDEDDDAEKATARTVKPGLQPVSELTAPCAVHVGQTLREYKSPKSGKLFFGHKHNDEWCFGKVVKN